MEVCNEWKVYIPVEAEVKIVPLWSLPNSVVRRIGLPVSDSNSSRKPIDSSDAIWICPATIVKKEQQPASCVGKHAAENVLEFLSTKFQAKPLKMLIVSSSQVAKDVLMKIFTGKPLSKEEPLLHDSAPPANQNAVVVYKGQVYLYIRKADRKKNKTGKLQPLRQAAIPSTSGLRTPGQTKEVIGGNQKKTADAAKVKRCGKAELKRKHVSPIRAEYSSSCLSDSGHRADSNCQYAKSARRASASQEAVLQPSYIQPQEEQEHPTTRGSTEHENNNLDQEDEPVWADDRMDGQDDEAGGSHGWTRTESLGVSAASTSKHMDFDFNELEQEEKIAQLKARFLQSEAALNNLLS